MYAFVVSLPNISNLILIQYTGSHFQHRETFQNVYLASNFFLMDPFQPFFQLSIRFLRNSS